MTSSGSVFPKDAGLVARPPKFPKSPPEAYITRLAAKRKFLAENAAANDSEAEGPPVESKMKRMKRMMESSSANINIKNPRKRSLSPMKERLTDGPLSKRRQLSKSDGQNTCKKTIRILKQDDIEKGAALGEGEYGEVFKCKVRAHDGTWHDAVLKILTSLSDREDFIRETECLHQLQGIKGVPVLYGRQFYPRMAFVMSYGGRLTLEKFLEKNSSNIPKMCQVLARTASIVSAIHRRGICHNDLHAGNVMVDESSVPGEPLPAVIDFGYALPFGSALFFEALDDWEDFHYDPVVSRDCGPTSETSDIYSFAKLISCIPDKKGKERMKLKWLTERALSTSKETCPSLEELRKALISVKRREEKERKKTRRVNICLKKTKK